MVWCVPFANVNKRRDAGWGVCDTWIAVAFLVTQPGYIVFRDHMLHVRNVSHSCLLTVNRRYFEPTIHRSCL